MATQAPPMKTEGQFDQQYPQNGYGQPQQHQQPQQVAVDNHTLLYVIAFFIPALAVYMQTGVCESEFIISLVLTFLFWIPGFIYACIVINKHQQAGIQPKVNLVQGGPAPAQQQYPQQNVHQTA